MGTNKSKNGGCKGYRPLDVFGDSGSESIGDSSTAGITPDSGSVLITPDAGTIL